MKQSYLIFLLLACSAFAKAEGNYPYLTVVQTDGTKTSLTAVGLSITFNNGNLVAVNSTTSESKTVALSNLASLKFTTTSETSGINSLEADSFGIDDAETIYDMSGRQIPSGTTLSKGVYVIKKGSVTRKIMVR